MRGHHANVLPVEDGLRLAASIPGVECLVVTADGQVRKKRGVVPLRATVDRACRPGDARRPGPGSENRPRQIVGRRLRDAGELRDRRLRGELPALPDARTSPSGSRTRAASPPGRWNSRSRSGSPARAGTAT